MAGIYLHIPFCKKKCHYCDFYKTLDTGLAGRYITALEKEMVLQRDYLEDAEVKTIYLGGGSPSVLSAVQVREILDKLHDVFEVSGDVEITIEANPDDISRVYARDLRKAGINRISLGIQSWNDKILKFLNRRHTAAIAEEAMKNIAASGIDNISVDMIYGLPGMSLKQWKDDLHKTLKMDIKHLSAYHLTIEKDTVFGKMKDAGELKEIEEEESERQFTVLTESCKKHGFIQYEISNFCKEGYYSIHNTNYWRQEPYLGLGPSAHSYNGESRQWNISDLQSYLKSIDNDKIPAELEILTLKDRYNEYIMTSLRTMWGINLDLVEDKINKESRDYLNNLATRFVKYGMMIKEGNQLVLTDQGKMISDNIIS
ncbi:MAG: radical SAM family heme chaperone HemW, partial [Spirochaetales bacterium]|nr:radical SAM family heme chaperone HemW [Spirochaetales bacterium]